MTKIYLIQRMARVANYDGPDYFEEEVDLDFGYFLDRDQAEERVEVINGPRRERFEQEVRKYEAALKRAEYLRLQGVKLGFYHSTRPSIFIPKEPDLYQVVEVEPYEQTN